MSLPHVRALFRHMWWADDHVLTSLMAADPRPRRAVELYAHVVGAEHVWLDRVEGRSTGVPVWPDPDVDACAKLTATARQRYEEMLGTLGDAELDRTIHYANSAGKEFDTRLEDILLHVALHGAYHRGQVALVLRDAGAEPQPSDYIAFVRGVPAATRRDAG